MAKTKTVLMCPPTHFGIEYEINPWMHQDNAVQKDVAAQQWQRLYDIYIHQLGWDVELVPPVKGLPDMVFATDNCVVSNSKVVLSNFRYPQRQPETHHYEKWLRERGYTNIKKPQHILEGGDILFFGDKIIAGYGFRTEREAHKELADYFGMEVISLRAVDPFFYHLDTALVVLNDNTVVFYPEAIDSASQKLLRQAVPNIIEATLQEAKSFGLNAVSNGEIVVFSDHSTSLTKKYQDAGLAAVGVPMTEFQKSGGGVKCLTLEL